MSKVYTIKTVDGNRYEDICDNKNETPIDMQIWQRRSFITVEDMNGCTRHFNVHSIVYIKEKPIDDLNGDDAQS